MGDQKEKKEYIKPKIEAHEAIALASGSGSACSTYKKGANEYDYFH